MRRLAAVDSPRERLLTVFDAQGEQCNRPGYHGCPFANATAEVPPGGLAERAADEYRTWLRELFVSLTEQLGVPGPKPLARKLQSLYGGASQALRMDRTPPPSPWPARPPRP